MKETPKSATDVLTENSLDNKNIYTLQFWLLCLSSLFFFTGFNMVIPKLPAYLSAMGGEDYKGYIIGLFTIVAGASRPFSGKLTDRIGRMPVLLFGAIISAICCAMYPLFTTISGFFFLRILHGLSTGSKPTATSAYVADIIPANRRGEALGIQGMFGITGMSLGQWFGAFTANELGMNNMFFFASFLSFLSVAIMFGMKETLKEKEPFRFSLLKLKGSDLIDVDVLPPAIVMVALAYLFGMLLTLAPDYSLFMGVSNEGAFFGIVALVSLLVRIGAGRVSDRVGRRPILFVTSIVAAGAMYMLVQAEQGDFPSFVAAACIFGFANGMATPVIFAWTIDRSKAANRGRALATTFIALELGITLGAFISADIYDNNPENWSAVFISGIVASLLAFAYLFLTKEKTKQQRNDDHKITETGTANLE